MVEANRLFFRVNHVGFVVSWLGGPYGTFLGGLLLGVLAMLALRQEAPTASAPAASPLVNAGGRRVHKRSPSRTRSGQLPRGPRGLCR